MDNKTFLRELKNRKLITQEAVDGIVQELSHSRKSAEELVYERRLIDDMEVLKMKSEVLGVPYKLLEKEGPSKELLKLMPEGTAQTYKVIPLAKDEKMLVVGMVNSDDIEAQDALISLTRKLNLNLGVYLIRMGDFERVMKTYSPYKSEVEAALKSIQGTGEEGAMGHIVELDKKVALTEEAPIIKLVSSTMEAAVRANASDIHIEPQRDRMRIRFRIDGDLKEVSSFPIKLHQPITSRIKVLTNLQLDETRRPQDGRLRTRISGRDIDFRVATFPTPAGEKVALRVLDPSVGLKSFTNLGMNEVNQKIMMGGITRSFGMTLITGPTGSGKTTTLYALMQFLNKEEVNVVTLEDPVEYMIDGANQSQVRPEIKYTFASGLRQILRQDPDIIMIGEIRDRETASLAINAALTGHIVLSTLHTNNAIGIIPRLLDMGIESYLLPSALNIMEAQRLVGRLCDSCKKKGEAPAGIEAIIEEEMGRLPARAQALVTQTKPFFIYSAKGCDECNQKGIVGRIAIFEALMMTAELRTIVHKKGGEEDILQEAARQEMLTMRQDGIIKALDGIISMEEILRETREE